MEFLLKIELPILKNKIKHTDKILLIGSCFTEHIFNFLQKNKFQVKQNSHGVIFNPVSVCKALSDVIENKKYTEDDLFFLNEYYHSWYHHSDFSCLKKEETLTKINNSIDEHHQFLKNAQYVFITLGSSFAYLLKEKNIFVSNNHRAPINLFSKELLTIEFMENQLNDIQNKLKQLNPSIQIIFTISPVRHSRDGVIENNRSKARLLETVHRMTENYYFPSYELVIDILRDYRFYDIDLVHPNYQATAYVWEQFKNNCIEENCFPLLKKLEQINKAKNHIPKDTKSLAHQNFLHEHLLLCNEIENEFSYVNLSAEKTYFSINQHSSSN